MPHRSSPRIPPVLWLPAILAVFLALPVRGANVDVTVGGASTVFTPATVNIQPGDSVTWHNAGGSHNVRADDNSFSNGLSDSAWTFVHTFNTAGTFGYFCDNHGAP